MGYQYRGNKPGWGDEKPKKPKRTLKPCGTNAAYQRHHRKGEVPCDDCLDARNKYLAGIRGGTTRDRRRMAEAQCGTYAGYVKHRRQGTEPCEPCRAKHAEYKRWYRASKREDKAA